MRDKMRKALDFAIAKEREAEAFYKEWAQKVNDPGVHALFAELAGVEYGHLQMLLRVTPEEMVERDPSAESSLDLSEFLVDVEAAPSLNLQEAMIIAMKREEIAVRLYSQLAEFGGEARPLFEALAREEQRHKGKLEQQYDEQMLTEN